MTISLGFGVRVLPSGRKGYVVQYNVGGRHGETRRKALGLHGVLTAEEARVEARKWLGERAMGKDPIAEQAANRAAETIEQLCERYLDATVRSLVLGKGGRPKKPSTLSTDRGRIKRHIVPLLGKKKVRELSSVDVARFIRDITTAKPQRTSGLVRYGRAIVKGGAVQRLERLAYCPALWPLPYKKYPIRQSLPPRAKARRSHAAKKARAG